MIPEIRPGDIWAGFLFIPFLLLGLGLVASSQVFLAIREIAINTRPDGAGFQGQYKVLSIVATFNEVIGWLIAGLSFLALVALPLA